MYHDGYVSEQRFVLRHQDLVAVSRNQLDETIWQGAKIIYELTRGAKGASQKSATNCFSTCVNCTSPVIVTKQKESMTILLVSGRKSNGVPADCAILFERKICKIRDHSSPGLHKRGE
jgi:hypothetical protein